jgi:Electron transfer DM13
MTDLLEPPAAEPTRQRRRRWPWAVAVAVVGLVVFVLIWFQPQKLFIDERVDAPIPVATAPTTDPGAPATAAPTAPAEPIDVANGTFVSLDHGTTGTVRILELADGSRVVRLEGLDTDNGPDLYLYLSTNPADGDESTFDDDHVNLGRLQGNLGDQNYDLPAGIDLTGYASVVIWCDRFNSAFGAADLR